MDRYEARAKAWLELANHFGRNYNLPTTIKDDGSALSVTLPARKAGLTSGGWYSYGSPEITMRFPYDTIRLAPGY